MTPDQDQFAERAAEIARLRALRKTDRRLLEALNFMENTTTPIEGEIYEYRQRQRAAG
jgi:hypothetical protein